MRKFVDRDLSLVPRKIEDRVMSHQHSSTSSPKVNELDRARLISN
jgi:hypothetical protein